jgi:hypothetical protein
MAQPRVNSVSLNFTIWLQTFWEPVNRERNPGSQMRRGLTITSGSRGHSGNFRGALKVPFGSLTAYLVIISQGPLRALSRPTVKIIECPLLAGIRLIFSK